MPCVVLVGLPLAPQLLTMSANRELIWLRPGPPIVRVVLVVDVTFSFELQHAYTSAFLNIVGVYSWISLEVLYISYLTFSRSFMNFI